jgi:hypothetical protein
MTEETGTEEETTAIDEIVWVTPEGNIGRGRELTEFTFQFEAEFTPTSPSFGTPITYTVSDGIFPESLALSPEGVVSGMLTDMDAYVPEFSKPEGYVIAEDGSNYGSYGSAQASTYTASFTVTASGGEASADATFDIVVINCYTSDGMQFLKDYSEQYGSDDPNGGTEKKMFVIDGVGKVTAQEYIDHLQAQGFLQPCNQ